MNGCHFVFSRCINSFRRTILKDRLCSVGGLQQYENEINPHRTNCRKRSMKFNLRNTSHIFVSSKLDLTRCNSVATLCSYLGYTSDELDSVWVVHDTWVSDSLRTSERKDETDYLVHEDLRPTKEMLPPSTRKRPMLLAEEDAGGAVGAAANAVASADVGVVGDGGKHIAEFAGLRLVPLLPDDEKEGSMSESVERQTLEDPLLLASTRYNSTTTSIKQSSSSSCSTSSSSDGASGEQQPGWMSRLKQTMQGKSLTRGSWLNAPLEWPAPPSPEEAAEEAAEEAVAEEAVSEATASSSSAQSNKQQHQASNNMYRLHGSESSLDSWRSSIDRSLSTSKKHIF